MRYISQLDYAHIPYLTRTTMEGADLEFGKKSTVRSSGCGLCSAIMVADRLLPTYAFEVEDAVALSYEVKANHKKGTDYNRFAPAFAEKLGLRWEATKDVEKLLNCLRTGGAAVLLVAGDREGHIGLFTHGAHYMAAIGEEPDGRIAILDPSYSDTKYDIPERQGKVEIKNGVITLCSIDILEFECAPKETPYHLFWRK